MTKVLFGLEQQGHIKTIEEMLDKHRNWDEINKTIGWAGDAANKEYIRLLRKENDKIKKDLKAWQKMLWDLQQANRNLLREWISVEDKMPPDDTRVDCKYDGVYDFRENILFWIDQGGAEHFGGFAEIDGKASQPATHWRPAI